MRYVVMLLLTGLSMLPAVASADDAPAAGRIALYVETIRANGCEVTEEQAPAVLGGAGFTQPESRAISQILMDEGRAEQVPDGFKLSEAACQGTE